MILYYLLLSFFTFFKFPSQKLEIKRDILHNCTAIFSIETIKHFVTDNVRFIFQYDETFTCEFCVFIVINGHRG